MDNSNINLEAILERLEKLEKENIEIKAELKTINSLISAMNESHSIDEVMTQIECAAKELTGSDSVTFYCMDNVSSKFFSEDGGRLWQSLDAAEEIKRVFDTQEISSCGTKALVPLVSSNGVSLGVLKAERQAGFDTSDLSRNFAKGSTFVENVRLGLQKEYQHQGRITDELTAMFNRQGLNEFLANTVVKAHNEGKSVNLLMSDIDRFKGVNDTYGHDAGDAILKSVADVLKEFTRGGADSCFRLGGEEMMTILITDTPEQAVDAAEKIRRQIESTSTDIIDKKDLPHSIGVTVSIGIHEMNPQISLTPENSREVFNEEFKLADKAVYEAKETGRNKVVSADEHTYMSYLAGKAIDVFIKSEGLTDMNAIDDVTEMIIESFINPTEEQDIHTVSEALRAYAEKGEGELSETAYFIADKMDMFADRLTAVRYAEERENETREITDGEAGKILSKAAPADRTESNGHSAPALQEQIPEKADQEEAEKPSLSETLKAIKDWADKIHMSVTEKNMAKEQEINKDGGDR